MGQFIRSAKDSIINRVIELLRIFEFRNLHLMRGGLILLNTISEEKLKND